LIDLFVSLLIYFRIKIRLRSAKRWRVYHVMFSWLATNYFRSYTLSCTWPMFTAALSFDHSCTSIPTAYSP